MPRQVSPMSHSFINRHLLGNPQTHLLATQSDLPENQIWTLPDAGSIMFTGKRYKSSNKTQNENPEGCDPPGFSCTVYGKVVLVLRLVAVWIIPVQPFTNVVGDYTCHNRDDKRYKIIQQELTPFLCQCWGRQRLYYTIVAES